MENIRWKGIQFKKKLPSESLAKPVVLMDVSVIGVYLIKYTPRNAIGKNLKKAIKFII